MAKQQSYSSPALGGQGHRIYAATDEVASRSVQTGPIAFGLAVSSYGLSGNQIKVPAATTDLTTGAFEGVTIYDAAYGTVPAGTTATGYQTNDVAGVLRKGQVTVVFEGADPASLGATVYVRYAAGGSGLGAFSATSGASVQAITGARFLGPSRTVDGTLVIDIDLNLPQ